MKVQQNNRPLNITIWFNALRHICRYTMDYIMEMFYTQSENISGVDVFSVQMLTAKIVDVDFGLPVFRILTTFALKIRKIYLKHKHKDVLHIRFYFCKKGVLDIQSEIENYEKIC